MGLCIVSLASPTAVAQVGASSGRIAAVAGGQVAGLASISNNWRGEKPEQSYGVGPTVSLARSGESNSPPKGLIGGISGALVGGGLVYAAARGACEGTRCSSPAPATLAGAAVGAVLGVTIELIARR
jgi:hypothetical protein